MPRIIPVLDVLHGGVVHAREGRREHYRPLHSVLRRGSDPASLAAAIRDTWRPAELYVADLDAIAGAAPAIGLYRELARQGHATWIDAGLRDAHGVWPLLDAGVARLVVGLETLGGREVLETIVGVAGAPRVVFSLDLRDGRPIIAHGADWGTSDPRQIAGQAAEAGYATIIILDLGRVGTGRGAGTLDLLRDMVRAYPRVEWVGGGGISGAGDVEALGRAGASAVLVGSAIHDGRMTVGAIPAGSQRSTLGPPCGPSEGPRLAEGLRRSPTSQSCDAPSIPPHSVFKVTLSKFRPVASGEEFSELLAPKADRHPSVPGESFLERPRLPQLRRRSLVWACCGISTSHTRYVG